MTARVNSCVLMVQVRQLLNALGTALNVRLLLPLVPRMTRRASLTQAHPSQTFVLLVVIYIGTHCTCQHSAQKGTIHSVSAVQWCNCMRC